MMSSIPPKTWSQEEAVELCRKVELIAPDFGCHVALTGGTLYKVGRRKDADVMFYRIRQVEEIDRPGLLVALTDRLGIVIGKDHGWVQKASLDGKVIDLFFPDFEGEGNYDSREVFSVDLDDEQPF